MSVQMRSILQSGFNIRLTIIAFLVSGIMSACAPPADDSTKNDLICVGNQTATLDNFQKAFENVKSAYSHSGRQSAVSLKDLRLRLLNQMTEELLLLERAEAIDIDISELELDQAVAGIKKGYPEGVFDRMLLEYAVSYRFWKERLKIRLLMEKVVAKELAEQITITPEDIADYYQNHYPRGFGGFDKNVRSKDIDKLIVKQLRREKAEKAYQIWLKKLQEIYPVEINEAVWKKINGG